MKLCEAHIDAIKISNEVTQDQKRYQTPHHLADCALLYGIHGIRSRFSIVEHPSRILDEAAG
jgi:hypothetical protein